MPPAQSQEVALLLEDIKELVPADGTFILADQAELGLGDMVEGRLCLPFTESDGQYWGPPEDDAAAVRELQSLRKSGASFIVFAWPAFWWLEHYRGLTDYLRTHFRCAVENERLVAFDLSRPLSGAPDNTEDEQLCKLKCGLRIRIENPGEFIQSALVQGGIFEPGVTSLIVRLLARDDLFFDIGANIGYFTLVGAATGARVHAFEPLGRLAARLRRNVELNHLESRVTIAEAAVSNRSGTATFYEAERVDDGSHSLLAGVKADAIKPTKVRTVRLDDYVEATGSPTPTLVKIDVEGAEALVLDGAVRTLEGAAPPVWIFETGDRLADQLGESARSVLGRFRDRGYRVFQIPDKSSLLIEVTGEKVSGELADYVAVKPDSPKLELILTLVNEALNARLQWLNYVNEVARELKTIIGPEASFILVDDDQLRADLEFGSRAIPFLEREGEYWGAPEDDATAVRELEGLRETGAEFIVFAAPAFWWLDYYAGFAQHLRANFQRVLESGHWIVFHLRRPGPPSGP